jgi:hypothetical protein
MPFFGLKEARPSSFLHPNNLDDQVYSRHEGPPNL